MPARRGAAAGPPKRRGRKNQQNCGSELCGCVVFPLAYIPAHVACAYPANRFHCAPPPDRRPSPPGGDEGHTPSSFAEIDATLPRANSTIATRSSRFKVACRPREQ
jgi:hypothetical protein